MKVIVNFLAAIGAAVVAAAGVVLALAWAARRGDRARRERWRDEHLLTVTRELGPEVVAANPSTWLQYVDAHGLKAPRGYRP